MQLSLSICGDDDGDDVCGGAVPTVRSTPRWALACRAFHATLRCDLTGDCARSPRSCLHHSSDDILECVESDVCDYLCALHVLPRSLEPESVPCSRFPLQMKLNLRAQRLLHSQQFDYHCEVCFGSVVFSHTGFHLLDPHDDVQMLRQPTNPGLLTGAS